MNRPASAPVASPAAPVPSPLATLQVGTRLTPIGAAIAPRAVAIEVLFRPGPATPFGNLTARTSCCRTRRGAASLRRAVPRLPQPANACVRATQRTTVAGHPCRPRSAAPEGTEPSHGAYLQAQTPRLAVVSAMGLSEVGLLLLPLRTAYRDGVEPGCATPIMIRVHTARRNRAPVAPTTRHDPAPLDQTPQRRSPR